MAQSSNANGRAVSGLPAKRLSSERLQRYLTPLMMVLDILGVNLAFFLAYHLRYELEWPYPLEEVFYAPYRFYFPVGLFLSLILLVTFHLAGVYRTKPGESWLDEFYRVVSGTATGIIGAVVFYFFYRPNVYSRLLFIYAAVLIPVVLGALRLGKHTLLEELRRRGLGVVRVLIVGGGELGRAVMRTLVAHPELGYQIVGFVDVDPVEGHSKVGRIPGLGPITEVPRLLSELDIDEVIITLPWTRHRQILSIVGECQGRDIIARVVPDLFQMSLSHMDFQDLQGIPLLGIRERSISRFNRALKRAVDLVGGLVGLFIFGLIYVPIAIAIKLESPGPVLYTQERVGRGGKVFRIYKFRSMYVGADEQLEALKDRNEADGPLFKIRDDPRCTRVGRIIRRLSLDEWPQFINVVKGEMSIVGPRPNRPHEVAAYKEWHKRRLEVAPGITGLWQVSGRSHVPFDEMVLLDIYYIENWSLLLDLKIMLRTLPHLLLGRGAY